MRHRPPEKTKPLTIKLPSTTRQLYFTIKPLNKMMIKIKIINNDNDDNNDNDNDPPRHLVQMQCKCNS